MNLEKIKVLLCAIETGSLSSAAPILGYTTAGVSKIVKSLEVELGIPLVIRLNNGIIPTDEALKILPLLQDMVAKEQQIKSITKK